MKIAVLYYGELSMERNYIDNHNRFLNNYDYDLFFSLSDKTHYGSGWKSWSNAEIHDFLLSDFPNIKGIQITHTPCIVEETEWKDYIKKYKLNLKEHDFNYGSLAYSAEHFDELDFNYKVSDENIKEVKESLKDINPIFHIKDLKNMYKIPFTYKEMNIQKMYTGFKMVEKFVEDSDNEQYDLIIMCNVNQVLPKIHLEKVFSSFSLENSLYFFPTSYSYINPNFVLGNFENVKDYSELWLKLRKYQYFNIDELKTFMNDKNDNPFMLESLHYFHTLNKNLNTIHLSNMDIAKLSTYYNILPKNIETDE